MFNWWKSGTREKKTVPQNDGRPKFFDKETGKEIQQLPKLENYTGANIEQLADLAKDESEETLVKVVYSLGLTTGALFQAIMLNKYNRRIPV